MRPHPTLGMRRTKTDCTLAHWNARKRKLAMTIHRASFLRITFVFVVTGILMAACGASVVAMPLATHVASRNAGGIDSMIAVRWRGRARGAFEQALIARAIANGVVPDPGPFYGRYLGHHGYPGHYPCCYEPQSFERVDNPYYTLSRAGAPNPTWWDYPVHWEGW
jgi:hypothetical protein